MPYIYLTLAILGEVMATSGLKYTDGFTRPLPTVLVMAGYSVAFYSLSRSIEHLPLGIVYATWSGVGIVFVSLFSAVAFKQIPDLPAIIGMTLIVAGVVLCHAFSNMGV